MEDSPKPKQLSTEKIQDAQIGLLEWELEERKKVADAEDGLMRWEMEEQRAHIAKQAAHIAEQEERHGIDPLTGARRREVLVHELDQSLKMIRGEIQEHRHGVEPIKRASLVFIDLDRFKQVNDQHGHPVGDKVLKTVADLLKGKLREDDLLARYGGDEFAVFLPDTDEHGALIAAEKLRAALAEDKELQSFGVTASIGVCSTDVSTAIDSENFIKHADGASYVAKRAGGNRVEAYYS